MRKSVRRVLYRLIPERLLPGLLFLFAGGKSTLLRDKGYAHSLRTILPVDEHDRPLPFMPYCVISVLEERLRQDFEVLEFGAGYSTLFFMSRVKRVVALEHDTNWVELLRARVTSNVELVTVSRATAESYCWGVPEGRRFDLIVVDGRHRVECFGRALDLVSSRGVILLDDSDRLEYAGVFALAHTAGYRSLSLRGHKPSMLGIHQATLFYRDHNALGI